MLTVNTTRHANHRLNAHFSRVLCRVYALLFSIMLCTTPIKAEETQTEPVEAPLTREYWYQQDLAARFPNSQLKQLLAGEQEFTLVTREDFTGRTKGSMMILPDWNTTIGNAPALNALRMSLNDYGWVTMAASLPDRKTLVAPKVPEPAERELSENALKPFAATEHPKSQSPVINENIIKDYEAQLKLRISSMYSEAENYPGFFVIIAQGSSAAVVMDLIAKQEVQTPDGVILISAFSPSKATNELLAMNIAKSTMPVLELYQKGDTSWVRSQISYRKKLSFKHFKAHYRQRELFAAHRYNHQKHRLTKEVYGWLTTMGM